MKAKLLERGSADRKAFEVKENRYPNFLKIWHYHPELELVVIKQSTGNLFVGDNIQRFEPGDVVLLGENLPHMWLNDEIYFQGHPDLIAEGYTIHFREDFLGLPFLELGSTEHLLSLFRKAKRGIRFNSIPFSVEDDIKGILGEKDAFLKLLYWLKLLHKLSKHTDLSLLTNEGYQHSTFSEGTDKTHEFIFKNFNKSIKLSDVAQVQGMNESAFSRYFKRIHRKTFSRYLIELRISYACKLLIENKLNISSICYESGFNNLSNFNKQFRKVMQMNPSEYLSLYR